MWVTTAARFTCSASATAHRSPTITPQSSTIVDRNYRVYLGTQSGHAFGLDPKGAVLFDVDLDGPVDSSPALTAAGTLVIGARNTSLTAIG
jgi:outer membrane protein assembly factor BamB